MENAHSLQCICRITAIISLAFSQFAQLSAQSSYLPPGTYEGTTSIFGNLIFTEIALHSACKIQDVGEYPPLEQGATFIYYGGEELLVFTGRSIAYRKYRKYSPKTAAKTKKEFSCTAPQIDLSSETVTDVDGNSYHTIKIGKQVWTIENLKTTRYNDSTPIPNITNDKEWENLTTGAYCDYANREANRDKYGILYNWYAVNTRKLAPKGWHVPTDAEWTELKEYLIATGYNWDGTKERPKIAKALADKTDWKTGKEYPGSIGNELSRNNLSGFSALPGGFRNHDGSFRYQSFFGYWWSATEREASHAHCRLLICSSEFLSLGLGDGFKGCGMSVRLLRDN